MELTVAKVADFDVTGDGSHECWQRADWQELARLGRGTATYATTFKTLYSETGMYFLVDCEDRRLHCTLMEDQAQLYTEDVVEVFLWPNQDRPVYFEYEISPLNRELVLLIPNCGGEFFGWSPWCYEGERRVRKATCVRGGEKASMAEVSGWSCEFFIPFCLLKGLGNVPPQSGTRWRGNVCRIDYDAQPASHWSWSRLAEPSFHRFNEYNTFVFE